MRDYILAIDQGTTSSRAILFGDGFAPLATGQAEFPQFFPRPGWVEHDPLDIWESVLAVCRQAIDRAGIKPSAIAALGITNQRETTLVWDAKTGEPVTNAIVWEDRRTADTCTRLKREGREDLVRQRTGLLLDPYFSATKLQWILDTVEGARERAQAGDLLFGTVDTWLIWKLTEGAVHATDATNAARTMLFDIHENRWDEELCALFGVPMRMLPDVRDCAADFGVALPEFLGAAIPIRGVAGDQQAATIGQACFAPGMVKSTYGTGCFALLNTGAVPVVSRNRLLTTLAYRLSGKSTYALEGSIFIAGAAVQWLRDGLKIITQAEETQGLAERSDPASRLYLVPAFTGLGAPHWDPDARGAVFGITRATSDADFARAALESVGYQTRDLVDAMRADWAQKAGDTVLRVDGGMTASDWTMQFLADILGAPVDRPMVLETTALGAAWLAGHAAEVWPGMDDFARQWQAERRFEPRFSDQDRAALMAGWRDAVARTRSRG